MHGEAFMDMKTRSSEEPEDSHTEDVRLMDLARNGDSEALDRIARKYQRPLAGFFRNRGVFEPSVVDELVQDTWIKFLHSMHRSVNEGGWDPNKGRLYSWLIGYIAINILRQSRRIVVTEGSRLRSLDEDKESGCADSYAVSSELDPAEYLSQDEEARLRRRAAVQLFRVTALCGGYPHQYLAYGLSKLVYGIKTRRGIQGSSARTANEHGPLLLDAIQQDFWNGFADCSDLDADTLQSLHSAHELPIRYRLPLRLRDLLQRDAHSRAIFGHILDRRVGETTLESYYTAGEGGFTTAIPDWCNRVEKRVRSLIGLELPPQPNSGEQEFLPQVAGCRRCKMLTACPVMSPDKLDDN